VRVPREWKQCIFCADTGEPGRLAARAGAQRLAIEGRSVTIATPASGDWNDALQDAGDDEEELARLRHALLNGKAVVVEGEIRGMPMGQFIDLQFPAREYLLKPWLTTTGLAMIDAMAGHGKTWLALAVGYAVASGTGLLGWEVMREARVLYVDGELPGALLQKRLRMLGAPLDDFIVLSRSQFDLRDEMMPDLGTEQGRDWLDAEIERLGVVLIILDSVSTLVRSGIDNEVESWRVVQEWSLKHRGKGRAVIYLHHHGRSGNPRGTSSREIVLDSRIKLARLEEKCTETETAFKLEFPKAREFYGAAAAPMIGCLTTTTLDGTPGQESEEPQQQVAWRKEALRSPMEEKVATLQAEGKTQTEIAKALKKTPGYISQIVKKLRKQEAADETAAEETE
jgi:putative DNA primase/helicase